MENTAENTVRDKPEAATEQPMISMLLGRTTFLLGLHFADEGKESLDDKVKRLIKKDIQNENF